MTQSVGDWDVAENWIDGEWTGSPVHADSIDPATGDLIGTYASATRADVERAIQAAKRAFETTPWRADRQGRLNGLASLEDFLEYKHIALHPGTV